MTDFIGRLLCDSFSLLRADDPLVVQTCLHHRLFASDSLETSLLRSLFSDLVLCLPPQSMTASRSSGGRKNINCSLVAGIVEAIESKEFSGKFKISSLNTKEFIRWAGL